ncbi:RAD51-associated protein 1 isoform X3 [Phascolarctos cinereus]|uniref:RAD51-associated protein 1 isoform X1 n=1 Tax=Phascolarctos cinereus TaxID=38626 RepID=A0A6P5LH05_PHACI|nr:RAD51-associated protein 1 isoform X1 [Phascolarctos cinereus]
MPRPVRNKKPVNYSQSLDSDYDDDDDFAPWTATSNKKSKIPKETKREKQEKPKSKNSHKEESPLQVKTPTKRMALDDKLYKRDLEVALALSVKEPSVATTDMQKSQDVEKCDTAESEQISISPHLSNCSVDGVCFNLNKITEEDDSHAGHRPRKAASKAMIQQRKLLRENSEDDDGTDSEPDFTSESNSDLSGSEGEDDEDFTTRKNKAKENKKRSAKVKALVEKKEKKTSKTSHSLVAPVVSHPAPVESKPAPKEACLSSKLVRKPLQTLSPLAESKRPKWVPPASSGSSSSSNQLGGVSVKSPSHSLRLGLSRFARVKPLHPTASST